MLLDPTCRWPIATVGINRNELAPRVNDRIQQGDTQNNAWAVEIDRSLRRGFVAAGRNKLKKDLFDMKEGEPLNTGVVTAGATLAIALNNPTELGTWLGIFHVMGVGGTVAENRAATGHHHLEQKRWSLFPYGAQPDRFAIAATMIAAQRLVRPIKL